MAEPTSPASPRLKRKQKMEPKDDGGETSAEPEEKTLKIDSTAASDTAPAPADTAPAPADDAPADPAPADPAPASDVKTAPPTPPVVKKVKKQTDPEVIFACNSCDYKNTLEMVRSHKLAANHMNHMDSRKRNGTIYGLRVAIVPQNDDEADNNDTAVEKAAESKTAGESNNANDAASETPKPAKKPQKPLTFVGLDEYFYCQDSNRMKCRNCSMIFQTKAVSGHIPRCQSKKYICALCSAPFGSEEEMQTHKKENHYVCDVCGRDFLDAGDFLERHQKKCKEMKEKREGAGIAAEAEASPTKTI